MRRAKVRDRPHHTQPLVPRQGVTGPRPAPPRQRCEAFPARGVPALKVGGVDPSVPVRSVSKRLHAGRRAIDSAAFRRDHPPSRVALDDLGKEDRAPWTPPGPSARARGPGGAQAIDLRLDLRMALLPLGAFARISALLQEAIALAEAGHDQQRLGWAYRNLTNQFLNMSDPGRALDVGQRALALATSLNDVALQISTRFVLARVYGESGDSRQAVDIYRNIVATFTDDLLPQLFNSLGPGATRVRASMAGSLAELGAFAEGLVYASEAIQIAQAAHNVFSLAIALWNTGYLYLLRGDLPQAILLLAQSLDVCQTGQVYTFFPRVKAYLGYAYALAGRLLEALPLLEQARATGMGNLAQQARIVALLSEAYGLAGRLDEARINAERALNLARTHGERGSEAWTLRLLGDLVAQEPAVQGVAATSYYAQALALAEELGMRPLQAHCQRGLGTLYARQGQRQQAHAALATAIDLYRDMEMTFWLPQAEAALARVV